jgi:hypothetical protein
MKKLRGGTVMFGRRRAGSAIEGPMDARVRRALLMFRFQLLAIGARYEREHTLAVLHSVSFTNIRERACSVRRDFLDGN